MKYLLGFLFFLFVLPFLNTVHAVVDPLSLSNNKVGIHIITPSEQEAKDAANLVNSEGGDWGYVTVLIQKDDRNLNKWQTFFNTLNEKHLIPIVRLATKPEGNYWQKPTESDAKDWANFLDSLYWPTKNRYVTVYNETNHGNEWGGNANPAEYAKELSKTIDALKEKSEDFYIINGGFDASSPQEAPNYYDQKVYMQEMERAVPGIFERLDGWSSHSYPQPNFTGSPTDTGRGSIRTFQWEKEVLKELNVDKTLQIFITETGWKHQEGERFNPSFLSTKTISEYYTYAFANVWNDSQIVAVTPFLLNYQHAPFDHFSFKKNVDVLGVSTATTEMSSEFLPHYHALASLPKTSGNPEQELSAELKEFNIEQSLVINQEYIAKLKVKNNGNSIWDENVSLIPVKDGEVLRVRPTLLPKGKRVLPGQEYTFEFKITPSQLGSFNLTLNLVSGQNQFTSGDIDAPIFVKSPVLFTVDSGLIWKDDPTGEYILTVARGFNKTMQKVSLDKNGKSIVFDTHQALPDLEYEFTLSKDYYQSKTIKQKVYSGENNLSFGELKPDISSAILNPKALWDLLPFSN